MREARRREREEGEKRGREGWGGRERKREGKGGCREKGGGEKEKERGGRTPCPSYLIKDVH